MGGVQLQSQAMLVRVFTCGGKNYLEGYTLKSLFISIISVFYFLFTFLLHFYYISFFL